MLVCTFARVVSVRAQETTTVILQIISREHTILLKITRLRRGQAIPYCTLRPLFSRTCAHTRPRDTRGFRYTRLLRMSRKDACEMLRHLCGSRDISVAFDNAISPLNAAQGNRAHLIVHSNRRLFVSYIYSGKIQRM